VKSFTSGLLPVPCFSPGVVRQSRSQTDRVKIPNGIIESTIASTDGVPVSKDPSQNRPWATCVARASPAENWTGVRNADRSARAACSDDPTPDYCSRSKTMSEDCLYLNVWTPAQSDIEKRPFSSTSTAAASARRWL